MASNIRKCDICGTIFKIKVHSYSQIKLPNLKDLDYKVERIKDVIVNKSALGPVAMIEYDVCGYCLLRLCEVLQGLCSIRGEE